MLKKFDPSRLKPRGRVVSLPPVIFASGFEVLLSAAPPNSPAAPPRSLGSPACRCAGNRKTVDYATAFAR